MIESPIKSTDIDFSLYSMKTLTPEFRIHWRILKDQKEIEMVLVVNGTSWVGFGWRPKNLTAECKKFPVLHDIGFENVSTAPEPISTVPEPSSEAEPKSSAPEPRSSAPEPEPSSEVSAEPASSTTAAEPSSEPEPSSSEPSVSEPEPSSSEPEPSSSEPASNKKSEPLALGSSKSKRVAAPTTSSADLPKIPSSKDEYTVSTSVSYRVSSVTGRRKRAVEKGMI